jgi:hypothetical protein
MKTLISLTVLVSAPCGQALALLAQQPTSRELVVREVFLPKTGVWESSWSLPVVFPDPSCADSTALFANQTLRGPGHLSGIPLGPCTVLLQSGRRANGGMESELINEWGSRLGDSRCALLGKPNGIDFVAMDSTQAPDLRAWDLQSGSFQRWIPHPPPPNGKPTLSGFYFILNAGDINNDGWEDLFFQDWATSGEGVGGCLNGKTGDPIWIEYLPNHDIPSRVAQLIPGPPPDVNGDGVSDLLYGDETVNGSSIGHRISALSGVDGSLLWSKNLIRSNLSRHTICCSDINDDQVPDLISMDTANFVHGKNGEITALSGSDGSTIWSRDSTFFFNLFPSALWHSVSGPITVTPNPSGTGLDLILNGGIIANGTWWEQTIFSYLDAKTGSVISTATVAGPLTPWHTEDLPTDLSPLNHAGDYDGDGFQELATTVYLANDDTGSTSIYPYALVLLGQRTLFGPDEPKIDSFQNFDLSIPAHPNSPFQLTFSTGFSPRTDNRSWIPQGWPTMLRETGLLRRTSTMTTLRGNLDGNGQGSMTIQFPNNLAYIGIPFYARALIGNPTNPGEIIAQSTLHTMVLRP